MNTYRCFFLFAPLFASVLTIALYVRRSGFSVRARTVWTVLLLVAAVKFPCFRLFGGKMFCPDLPAALIWSWDFLYSGAMILFVLSVLLFFRFRGRRWLLPLVAWGLSAWGLYGGIRVPDVHAIELSFPDLPASLEGYRIVQLTDLHCSCAARRWRTQAIVDRANALRPDLICLTGDYADGPVDRVGPFLEPIRELRAKDGVFACDGNHEYYHDFDAWTKRFYVDAPNICFLQGRALRPRPGLSLTGLFSAWKPRPRIPAVTNGEFRVLLQHEPEDARQNVLDYGCRLQLSGHTHGGIAPIFRPIIARANGGFVRGIYRLGESVLYVSPGCGQWAGFPMRILNPSEITLITLRRGPRTDHEDPTVR